MVDHVYQRNANIICSVVTAYLPLVEEVGYFPPLYLVWILFEPSPPSVPWCSDSKPLKVYKMSSIYPTLMPHHVELAKASAEKAEKGTLKTAPFDPRFPNQNLTRYCYQSYIDFQKCKGIKGEDYEACQYFKGVIKSICPKAWLEKWDTQVEEGIFAGKL